MKARRLGTHSTSAQDSSLHFVSNLNETDVERRPTNSDEDRDREPNQMSGVYGCQIPEPLSVCLPTIMSQDDSLCDLDAIYEVDKRFGDPTIVGERDMVGVCKRE